MANFLRFPFLFGGLSLPSRNALTAFFGLEPSAQKRITDAIKELELPHSRKKLTAKARQLHQELAVLDVDTLYGAMDAMTDLLGIPSAELPDVLPELLKDTGIPLSPLESILKEIASDPAYVRQRAINEFTNQALPSIRAIQHFCATRMRFDKEFNYNEDTIESYDPKVVDRHPVVVFQVLLDDREKPFSFQADQERLDRLINELIAAQRQLKIVADSLPVTKGEKNRAK